MEMDTPTNTPALCHRDDQTFDLKGQVVAARPPRLASRVRMHVPKSAEDAETVVISRS